MKSQDINYNYIRRLTIFLKKEKLCDLFPALVLAERYLLVDDIKILTKKEIKDAYKKYAEYLKSKDTLINRRWL